MNIYDIAKEAGVSISTVSRVINGQNRVSRETIERVRRIMEEHNYTPSPVARGLVKKQVKSIGIISIDIRGMHYASIAYSAMQEFRRYGYSCLFCNAGEEEKEQEEAVDMMAQSCIDGVIFIGSAFETKRIQRYIAKYLFALPVVMVNAYLEMDNVYSILCDEEAGISDSIDLLYAHGSRKICYVRRKKLTASGRRKELGYTKAVERHRLQPYLAYGDNNEEGGEAAVREAVERFGRDVTAYVFETDIMAVGGLRALCQQKIRIPEDAELIAYNDSVLSRCAMPPLTAVNNRLEQLGSGASRLLLDIIERGEGVKKTVLSPAIIQRQSTGKPENRQGGGLRSNQIYGGSRHED